MTLDRNRALKFTQSICTVKQGRSHVSCVNVMGIQVVVKSPSCVRLLSRILISAGLAMQKDVLDDLPSSRKKKVQCVLVL